MKENIVKYKDATSFSERKTAHCSFPEWNIYNEEHQQSNKHRPCVYYIKDYIILTFMCYFLAQIMCGSVLKGRRSLIPSMVNSVSSLSGWKRLNVSPDDTVRMYNWRYETKFLAGDIGPERSGQIHFITSKIKPDWRTGHTFDELIPQRDFWSKKTLALMHHMFCWTGIIKMFIPIFFSFLSQMTTAADLAARWWMALLLSGWEAELLFNVECFEWLIGCHPKPRCWCSD